MKYYKVRTDKDNIYDYRTGYTTIRRELLTPKERATRFPSLRDTVFELVNINRTYTSFGARFEA